MPRGKHPNSLREEIVAIDVGTRLTKAVCLRRRGTEVVLVDYAMAETPVAEKALSTATLAEHLRKVVRLLKTPCRQVVLAVGPAGTVLAHSDLPQTSPSDLRKMIKLSPKSYLQQDLPDHLFDCHFKKTPGTGDTTLITRRRKSRVLVGGVRRRAVEELEEAARLAGLNLVEISLVPVGLANAFRLLREDTHPEPVALLDIGANHSVINVVQNGDLKLTRTMQLGSDKFADVLTSGERAGDGDEVSPEVLQANFQKAILTFAREVDASVGFFSSQHEKPVGQLYVSGGTARSAFVLQALESELSLSCEAWHLERHLKIELPEARARELEYEAPQLAVAVGLGAGQLLEHPVRINFLAEEQEAVEQRRRDPVRRACFAAAAVIGLVLLWAAAVGWQVLNVGRELDQLQERLNSSKSGSTQSMRTALQAREFEATSLALYGQATNRVLFAPVLNALQHVVPEDIVLHRVQVDRSVSQEELPRTATAAKPAGPKWLIRERIVMSMTARNYGGVTTQEAFLDALPSDPFFKAALRQEEPVRLRSQSQVMRDVVDGDREYTLIVVDCFFKDRVFNP